VTAGLTRRRALGTTAGLLACAGSGAMVRRAAAAELAPISIALIATDPGMQPLYAQDQGFFTAAGLDAAITVLGNSSAIVAAVAAGTIDVGNASISVVAFARQHGIPIRYIAAAGIYTGPPGNTILMVAKTSTIASGADLAGKTIALGALRDLTQFETSAWIERTGGDAKSVRLIELPYPEMATALDQGRADAAALIEPYVTAAKTSARVLANLSDTMGGPYMVAGWVSSEAWINRNPDLVKRFVHVMQRSATWANAHQRASADILVRYTKIRPEVAATMNRIRYEEGATIDPAMVQRPVDMLVKYGTLSPLSAKDIIASQ
jgi:NitT/TauT family transport system substrate-binding protein